MGSNYRIVINNVQGGTSHINVAIAEIELRTTTSGADVTSSEANTVSASGNIGASYVASKAIDDTTTTMWNCGINATSLGNDSVWWKIEFDNSVGIVEYTLRARHDSYVNDTPTEWKFQKWNGSDWDTLETESTTADWTSGETRTFSVPIQITLDAQLPTLGIEAFSGAAASATLPDLGITATGIRAPYVDAVLPALSLETPGFVIGRVFSRLPELRIEAQEDTSIKISIDPREDYWPRLPDLRISAKSGERANMDVRLPELQIEARGGSYVEAKLPELSLSATCLPGWMGTVDVSLPALEIEARTGSRAEIKFPPLSIEAQGSTPISARLNKKLPSLKLEASISGVSASLSSVIPFPQLTATASREVTATLDQTLPGLKIRSTALSGAVGSVDASLPELKITARSNSVVIQLDAYLPPLTTGYASGSDSGNVSNVMTNSSRLGNTLLRHQRWA